MTTPGTSPVLQNVDLTDRRSAPLRYQSYLRLLDRLRRNRRECVLFCEHPPIITAGSQASMQNLLVDASSLAGTGVDFVRIKRGGDMTAHEPGQLIIYVHLDLKRRAIGLADYFDGLLKISRQSLRRVWSLETQGNQEAPGLYARDAENRLAKLLSIGVDFRRGFSGHGIALNVKNDLRTFDLIHPCGHAGQSMTSIEKLNLDVAREAEFKREWLELLPRTFT